MTKRRKIEGNTAHLDGRKGLTGLELASFVCLEGGQDDQTEEALTAERLMRRIEWEKVVAYLHGTLEQDQSLNSSSPERWDAEFVGRSLPPFRSPE